MKAPAKVHKLLVENGYGYCGGSYSAYIDGLPIIKNIRFERNENGVLIHLGLFYPLRDSAAGMIPDEVSVLRADGRLWFGPFPIDESQSMQSLHFPKTDVEELYAAVGNLAFSWLDKMQDFDLMLTLIDALMGECELPEPFGYMAKFPFLRRKPTIDRLVCKASYLNYCGRFEQVQAVLADDMLEKRRKEEFCTKLLEDAQKKRITVTPEFLEHMRPCGLELPLHQG